MQKLPAVCCSDTLTILKNTVIVLLGIAIVTRLYLYWYPKDLWLDEGSLFWALYHGSWKNILSCDISGLSCPLFFALYNKLILSFSCTQHAIYFVPTCTGIALVILFSVLARKIDGNVYAVLCVALFCIFRTFVYYSSEFKPYIFDAFISSFLIYIYIYDLLSHGAKRFLSWKYPLVMSISLLVSSTSVFISAGLATTIALYLRFEKAFSLKRIFLIFLTRYSLFALVCLLYYFFYLKNGSNSSTIQNYWNIFFFPTSLSAWPEYIRNLYFDGQAFGELSLWTYTKCAVMGMFFLLFVCGSCLLWRKNRFIMLALVIPFGFAVISGFFLYPLILGANVWSRLSLYLLPLLILLAGQALLPLANAVLARISRKMLLFGVCSLVALVLCVNVVFAVRGMGHEQITPLIEKLVAHATADDKIIISDFAHPVWNYYTSLDGVHLPVTVLPNRIVDASDDELAAFFSKSDLSGKKTLYILYTYLNALPADRVKAYLEKRGYRVEVCAPRNAQLQTIVLQEEPAS